MTLDEVDRYFKSTYQFTLQTGISHSNLLYWRKHLGYVPIRAQYVIQAKTDKALKANIQDTPLLATKSATKRTIKQKGQDIK